MKNKVKRALDLGSDLVELRIDYLKDFNPFNIEDFADRCIITCRAKNEGGLFDGKEEERKRILEDWSKRKPRYMDLELSLVEKDKGLLKRVEEQGVIPIISWHKFDETPELGVLLKILEKASFYRGIVKIVTLSKGIKDNITIFKLYKYSEKGRLVAFCMGEEGRISRILCLTLSSPFTYASLPNEATAPGQFDLPTMKEIRDALKNQF